MTADELTAAMAAAFRGTPYPTHVDPDGKAYPILPAYADELGQLRVYCDVCLLFHFHGRGEGHRVAHCVSDDSIYARTGYILQSVGNWSLAVRDGKLAEAKIEKARRKVEAKAADQQARLAERARRQARVRQEVRTTASVRRV